MSDTECFKCDEDTVIHLVGTTKGPSAQRREPVYQCSSCNLYTTESGNEIGYENIVIDPAKINHRRDKAFFGY